MPEEPQILQKSRTVFGLKHLLVVALIWAGLIILLLLNYLNAIPLSKNYPNVFGWLPHSKTAQETSQTPSSVRPLTQPGELESCNLSKDGNPLVQEAAVLSDGRFFGTFFGNINDIEYDGEKQSASLELISPRGDQKYAFKLKEEPGLVYDGIDLRDLTLSDLKRGQTVLMSFQCLGDQEKIRITQVRITGK